MLGEFGLQDKSMRNPNYKLWLDTVLNSDGAGALYWILSGLQDDGTLYPDYDGFTVYCPSPVCTTIANFGREIGPAHERTFDPVADHDTATTPFNTPVTLNATANDVAWRTGISPRDARPRPGGERPADDPLGHRRHVRRRRGRQRDLHADTGLRRAAPR